MSKRKSPIDLNVYNNKQQRRTISKVGFFYLKSIDVPFISRVTNSPTNFLCLRSDRLYTIGRKPSYCNLIFNDPRVSKRHCQIFCDSSDHKIYVLDGYFTRDFSDIRNRLCDQGCKNKAVPSLNGLFVNGRKVGEGEFMELVTGDEVQFVCANNGYDSSFDVKIGFVVERVVFSEEVVRCFDTDWKANKIMSFRRRNEFGKGVILSALDPRMLFLLKKCRRILHSDDPISYIQTCLNLERRNEILSVENGFCVVENKRLCDSVQNCSSRLVPDAQHNVILETTSKVVASNHFSKKNDSPAEGHTNLASICIPKDSSREKDNCGTSVQKSTVVCTDNDLLHPIGKGNQNDDLACSKEDEVLRVSPGKNFFLNRLDFKGSKSSDKNMVVSLPELLSPVKSLSRMFIATFTSDILWFLSYCDVPNNIPVTIACHNTERCWSSSLESRISTPYEQYPNLVMISPPFPDVIAFGQDRKKQGIACHHPKLLVLQREHSIRVVVTSANLVSKQWNDVTNTVWWQDFPLRSAPDYLSLFTSVDEEASKGFKSDFAAQLAGFMASLLVDVPSQAHWITELTKYDFGGANGHLVSSVPGMHRHISFYPRQPMYFLSGNHYASRLTGMKFFGYVEASLVGLKHRFHTAADSNGAALKSLAASVGNCRENTVRLTEVVLRRNHNIPADANAVSVLISNLDEFSEGECILLGFLPRNIAKWVASLSDAGFFSFSAYIYPKEVLAAALEGSNNKVQLMLYVSQGPYFSEISSLLQPDHAASISSLVASLQRCVGLSRLHQVVGRYKWPELLETDFVYGSSSIGTSINSQFLAAFSSAAGKRSIQFSESEESDPEWGRWNVSEESKKPSMKIIFPTIERVKNSACGIWPSRRLLCLSEGTWQRLRSTDLFHDAVPHPSSRIGYPMHIKVARRRFKSKSGSASFGWIYCGSHNFSAAAWGRPIFSNNGVSEATSHFLGSRLHISNYELGIIFVVPPDEQESMNLDDITLPFVMPAPRYKPSDRAATKKAMSEAVANLARKEKEEEVVEEEMMDEILDDEEMAEEVREYVVEEREEEKAYAETLWSQVDSSQTS
ncbi:hypothetical protein ACHQM5_025934 [Ranunculus cassubicifolius]